MPVPPLAPLSGFSDTVTAQDAAGRFWARPCPRNLRLGREPETGDMNALLSGEISNVSVRVRRQRFAQFV